MYLNHYEAMWICDILNNLVMETSVALKSGKYPDDISELKAQRELTSRCLKKFRDEMGRVAVYFGKPRDKAKSRFRNRKRIRRSP